jgi:hypothetical protein
LPSHSVLSFDEDLHLVLKIRKCTPDHTEKPADPVVPCQILIGEVGDVVRDGMVRHVRLRCDAST